MGRLEFRSASGAVGRGRRLVFVLGLLVGALLLQAGSAGASVRPRHYVPTAGPRVGTELVWSGELGHGVYGVDGFIPTAPFNPLDGYPTSDPSTGFEPLQEYFAGIIVGTPSDGSPKVDLYCIDIRTDTFPGFGYALGDWDSANVPNVGYVARLLANYYPNTDEPSALTDLNERAAAVQAAIWFFSDGYVLSTSSPLHDAVAAIVKLVIAKGPLIEPSPPSLSITPPHLSGPASGVLGPFTVTSGVGRRHRPRRPRSSPSATVTATGATMYANPAGTTQLGDGTTATVSSGQRIWVRSAGASTAALTATAVATVPSGNVYLYDGNTGDDAGQRLILAATATLTTTVQATAEFLPPGSLVVKKTISGAAAGSQGRVDIQVACDDGVERPGLVIPAGAHAGMTSHTYNDIPAGTSCTVTETANGSTKSTSVEVSGDGQQVTIPSGGSKTVPITNVYSLVPGSLVVRKTITGPAAGQQRAVTIHTVCDGRAQTPDFVIPAGAPAGEYTKQYDQLLPGATCTVTETADGHTSAVSVVVTGSGQTVSVAAGDVAEADVSDAYGLAPGQLDVTKAITGPLAGQQGTVVIHTVCNPAAITPDLVIPAGTPTSVQSQIYSGIPAGTSCAVTETANGQTSTVTPTVSPGTQTHVVPPGGAAAAQITDAYGPAPGSLLVTKTIAGSGAGQQGPVEIHVACNGVARSPDFVIPAKTKAGSLSHSFDGIPAGSVCTVTETADGATRTVTATATGSGQDVTVPAGHVAAVNLTDVYRPASGFLKVTKTLAGSAAGRHGRIAILVSCGGPLRAFAFRIPAGTHPGPVTRWFSGLPAGSRCTVAEIAIGRTAKVRVLAIGRRQKVTIHADRRSVVHLTDKFSRIIKVPVSGLG